MYEELQHFPSNMRYLNVIFSLLSCSLLTHFLEQSKKKKICGKLTFFFSMCEFTPSRHEFTPTAESHILGRVWQGNLTDREREVRSGPSQPILSCQNLPSQLFYNRSGPGCDCRHSEIRL